MNKKKPSQRVRQHLDHEAVKLRDGYKGCHECVPRPLPHGGTYGWIHCPAHRCEAVATYASDGPDLGGDPCKHAGQHANPIGRGLLCPRHAGQAAFGRPLQLRKDDDGAGR